MKVTSKAAPVLTKSSFSRGGEKLLQKTFITLAGSGQEASQRAKYSEQSDPASSVIGVFFVIFIFSKCSRTFCVEEPRSRQEQFVPGAYLVNKKGPLQSIKRAMRIMWVFGLGVIMISIMLRHSHQITDQSKHQNVFANCLECERKNSFLSCPFLPMFQAYEAPFVTSIKICAFYNLQMLLESMPFHTSKISGDH